MNFLAKSLITHEENSKAINVIGEMLYPHTKSPMICVIISPIFSAKITSIEKLFQNMTITDLSPSVRIFILWTTRTLMLYCILQRITRAGIKCKFHSDFMSVIFYKILSVCFLRETFSFFHT